MSATHARRTADLRASVFERYRPDQTLAAILPGQGGADHVGCASRAGGWPGETIQGFAASVVAPRGGRSVGEVLCSVEHPRPRDFFRTSK